MPPEPYKREPSSYAAAWGVAAQVVRLGGQGSPAPRACLGASSDLLGGVGRGYLGPCRLPDVYVPAILSYQFGHRFILLGNEWRSLYTFFRDYDAKGVQEAQKAASRRENGLLCLLWPVLRPKSVKLLFR